MEKYFIIGGTGTLGEAFTRKAISLGHQVTCYSRCELKQKELIAKIPSPERLKCVVGDVRDLRALTRAMVGHSAVFLFAALKHVDTLEANPEEAFKTNVQGTINALDAAEACGVKNFVFSSTDKAVDPVNAYGYSKALAEKIIQARTGPMSCKIYRWGNVIGSRGSVIPQFVEQLKKPKPVVTFTNLSMTRFWIKIEEAVEFIFKTFEDKKSAQILIPALKAAPVVQVVDAIAHILGVDNYTPKVVGIRPGEKLHECLMSVHYGKIESKDPKHLFNQKELVDYLTPIVLGSRQTVAPKFTEAVA